MLGIEKAMKDKVLAPTVLDLFCGCGGLSLGFMQAGYEVKLGIDNCKDAIETFKSNHKSANALVENLLNTSPAQISKISGLDSIDLIIGGPPCQGFSIAGKRLIDDERNQLYKSFVEYINFFRPKAFLMENVPNMATMAQGSVKKQVISDFEGLGYTVNSKVLLASDYGVPQSRKRLFFIGFRDKIEFQFPLPTIDKVITSYEAISDLPNYSLNDGEEYPVESQSLYQQFSRRFSTGIYNHQVTNHSEQTKYIISLVPNGGNYKSLPEELKNTRNVNIAWTRLNSLKPSFTIDTGHRHHFHYEYNRVPTVRESARIQSFPDDFIFFGSKTSQYKQVGNAVPPLLAKAIAMKIKEYL